MQFRLEFRSVDSSDIGVECPFLPDAGQYERHFNYIVQDICNFDGVVSAVALNAEAVFVRTVSLDLSEFKSLLKPALQHHFQYLRIVKIDEVEVDL